MHMWSRAQHAFAWPAMRAAQGTRARQACRIPCASAAALQCATWRVFFKTLWRRAGRALVVALDLPAADAGHLAGVPGHLQRLPGRVAARVGALARHALQHRAKVPHAQVRLVRELPQHAEAVARAPRAPVRSVVAVPAGGPAAERRCMRGLGSGVMLGPMLT